MLNVVTNIMSQSTGWSTDPGELDQTCRKIDLQHFCENDIEIHIIVDATMMEATFTVPLTQSTGRVRRTSSNNSTTSYSTPYTSVVIEKESHFEHEFCFEIDLQQ